MYIYNISESLIDKINSFSYFKTKLKERFVVMTYSLTHLFINSYFSLKIYAKCK